MLEMSLEEQMERVRGRGGSQHKVDCMKVKLFQNCLLSNNCLALLVKVTALYLSSTCKICTDCTVCTFKTLKLHSCTPGCVSIM